MNKPFKINVNELYDFNFNEDEINSLDIVEKSNKSYHVIENNQTFEATLLKSDFNKKKYSIQINGNVYEIKVSDELDILINELGMEASLEKKENDVKAPMPGLIVSIDVVVGQEVKENEGILVLEAMKMENTLLAPRDGIIKSIDIKVGDKVEKNTVLIEMEA
ncbi:biotin/lipoyl-containing protein [Tenacibaculum halocynthiae]|uniref:acetyl-CoA carboxylase biotin carboxyl carrier protein subunit n=1 Tax=Tenacibaculum halocynthiae TaxID=1254437 RepID=UPI003D64D5C8